MYYGHLRRDSFIPVISSIQKQGKGFSVTVKMSDSVQRDMALSSCITMLSSTGCQYRVSQDVYNFLKENNSLPFRFVSDIEIQRCILT